jgi:2-dehydropantoate 2-reductase
MMEEAARIGAALGMQSGTPVSTSIEKMIGKIRTLGAFKMSMLRDNAVELDALLTVTHDIGQLVGVPTPFIDGVLGLAGYGRLAWDCSI